MASTSASSVSLQHRKRGRNQQGAIGGRGPGGKAKRKWRPNQDQKVFEGSTKEGQGFALWRKKKVQSEYKKLLRKQKKANPKEVSYSDHYPEHLRHLYVAEEERLKSQEKLRKPETKPSETKPSETKPSETKPSETKPSETKPSETKPSETIVEEQEVIPKKKFKKKTSNQKAKEEYERVQRERAKKREEAENNRRKREEAIKLHKQKRMEAYKVLSAKTRKGQPNFNVHMEYLLKKIQSKS